MTALRFVSSMHPSPRQVRIYEYTAMEKKCNEQNVLLVM